MTHGVGAALRIGAVGTVPCACPIRPVFLRTQWCRARLLGSAAGFETTLRERFPVVDLWPVLVKQPKRERSAY
jgi:hypothetical protein